MQYKEFNQDDRYRDSLAKNVGMTHNYLGTTFDDAFE
jgi:hypothetical protein